MAVVIEAITIYPVKSTRGQDVQSASVEARGLCNDRRWMISDPQGQFFTARKDPALLGVTARVEGNTMRLSSPAMPTVTIDDAKGNAGPAHVHIWRSDLTAQWVSKQADEWFSELLARPCRLVYMAEQHERAVDPEFALAHDIVSFADGFPLLLTNQASLQDLNRRAPIDAQMTRFRPNVTIGGADAWDEDNWQRITLGTVEFDVPKPCARCVMTTIDPRSLQADAQQEPLRTLSQFRNDRERGILFGVNLIPRGTGPLRVGDVLSVVR